jgi:mRNA-degrading endonuclease RelE of RelBE toxin-antitoxin system
MQFGGNLSMKKIEINFTEDSKRDYEALSDELREICDVILRKLKSAGKKLGIPLGNKHGMDLRGYYKLYFDEARYRIVYTVTDETVEITEIGRVLKEILEIVGIGERDKELIYKTIWQRVSGQDDEE